MRVGISLVGTHACVFVHACLLTEAHAPPEPWFRQLRLHETCVWACNCRLRTLGFDGLRRSFGAQRIPELLWVMGVLASVSVSAGLY